MEIFAPDLHSFPLLAFLDEAKETLGSAVLAELLATYGLKLADLTDSSAWVSLEFVQALLEDMQARADRGFCERACRRGMTPKYIGPLYPLVFAFGSTLTAYKQLGPLAGRLNKTGQWVAEVLRRDAVRLSWTHAPSASPETSPLICKTRLYQLQRIPTLFARPPAEVTHTQCLLRGGGACVYDVTWDEPPPRRHAVIGFAAGAVAGLVATALGGVGAGLVTIITAAFAIGGWALGRILSLRQELASRIKGIGEQHDALERVTRTNEDRFAELLEAKAEVDQKVEQRTHELREASGQLADTLSKLQDLDRMKTDFFNNVSHELRSPLTLILAPLDDLVAGRSPPGGERAAHESMHRSASRLLRLINQLLDLAKIDAGEMKITTVATHLPELVRNSMKTFDAAARQKGVLLHVDAPENMPAVQLDASWIDSAITNLVANALRLTNSGGGVRVTVEDHVQHVSVAVSDDGPGIAPEDQAKVFERFAQGDSSTRVIGGTGIGLALVREATRLHGGDVVLESELGKGSTFTLVLPRLEIDPAQQPLQASEPSLAAAGVLVQEVEDVVEAASREGPAPGASLAIVVEDNPELRTFIADVLATRYRVRAARDGVQGLELARELRPEVIVSDVAMPQMDGYELCRRLRADDETKNIPVLLVTARTDLSSVMQGFAVGANDYLLKPFHATELLARVDVHVRLRRLTAQLARNERLAALGSLAASVAHNVRNPLSALISGLPAMRNRLGAKLDPSSAELMGIMLDCAERIERMTLDLLDLSRIDREISGDFAPGVGLLACTRMFASRIVSGVEMRTDVDDSALTSGRAGDMNHVFMNVVDNALRAVGNKGAIEIRGAVEGSSYVVTVADSGGGVAQESLDRVFEPFWTTRAAGEGTGLGLSIARQIVEEHGGSISVSEAVLGGAQFTIRLPLRKAARAVA